jgi:hypothetical protein
MEGYRLAGFDAGEENDGVGGHGFFASDGADTLSGFGFDVDGCGGESEQTCEAIFDRRLIRCELGVLCVNGAIEVYGLPTGVSYPFHGESEEASGVDSEIGGIGIGEMFADISFACGTENGVGDRVEQDVGVAVSIESEVMFDGDSPENQGASRSESVRVVPQSHPVGDFQRDSGFSWRTHGDARSVAFDDRVRVVPWKR